LKNLKKTIELYHALVLRGSIEDIERIIGLIESETDARILYRHHSGRYLKIVEGDVHD